MDGHTQQMSDDLRGRFSARGWNWIQLWPVGFVAFAGVGLYLWRESRAPFGPDVPDLLVPLCAVGALACLLVGYFRRL